MRNDAALIQLKALTDSIDSEHIYIYIYISNEMYILITPDQTVQLGSGDPLGGSILDPPHPARLPPARPLPPTCPTTKSQRRSPRMCSLGAKGAARTAPGRPPRCTP